MTDDTSEIIATSSCYYLSNDSLLYAYGGNIRRAYVKIGNHWYYQGQTNATTIPTGANCISYSTVQSLNSYPEFYPIYMAISLCLVVIVVCLFWAVIRKILEWRV